MSGTWQRLPGPSQAPGAGRAEKRGDPTSLSPPGKASMRLWKQEVKRSFLPPPSLFRVRTPVGGIWEPQGGRLRQRAP